MSRAACPNGCFECREGGAGAFASAIMVGPRQGTAQANAVANARVYHVRAGEGLKGKIKIHNLPGYSVCNTFSRNFYSNFTKV